MEGGNLGFLKIAGPLFPETTNGGTRRDWEGGPPLVFLRHTRYIHMEQQIRIGGMCVGRDNRALYITVGI